MKNLIFSVIGLFLVTHTSAQTVENDKAHSSLGFSITHFTISEVVGRFNDFTTGLTLVGDDITKSSFTLNAKTASVDTGVERRDEHLKAPDYFSSEAFPELTFKSVSIKKVSDKEYELKGDLTLKGITKPVTLKLIYNGNTFNEKSKSKVYGFAVKGTIKRSDFGVAKDTPEAMLSDEVKLNAHLQFHVK